jgi:hypothetical protein
MLAPTLPATAQEFSEPQKSEIERIIKDYIVSHPEVLQEAIAELDKRQAVADTEKAKAAVAGNAEALFNSSRQVVLGNAKGDVTMVEFFDYNCGFCKKALADMMELLKDDAKLRIVLKEFPVLGPGSVEAGKVAVAVRMQGTGGKGHHHHHHVAGSDGSNGAGASSSTSGSSSDPLLQALSGASSTQVANSDGTTTTSVTYADGSKVTLTSPPATKSSSIATSSYNFIEQLIQREAKAISSGATAALSLNV